VVKAIKNVIIKIKKDSEFKRSLKSKEWDNAFVDIRKLFKITYKVNKIKTVWHIVRKEWGKELLEGLYKFFYICYILKNIHIFIN